MTNNTTPNFQGFTRWSDFQRMRREHPDLYRKPEVHLAMHSLAEKYGAAFFEDRPRHNDGTFAPSHGSLATSQSSNTPKQVVIDWDKLENASIQEIAQHIKDKMKENNIQIEGEDTNEQA